MQGFNVFSFLIILNCVACGCCSVLAMSGYVASNPVVRNFLIRSGLGTVVTRKASLLYETSNFRHASDQGTGVRKAQMKSHDIIEIYPKPEITGLTKGSVVSKRNRLHENYTTDEDRVYSEKLFSVLTEMDKKSCVFRLVCEIGSDPNSFGIMGYKINSYIRSVPPVTWNSETFSYLEAFKAGSENSKNCIKHFGKCPYNLNKIMRFLFLFMSPINLELTSNV